MAEITEFADWFYSCDGSGVVLSVSPTTPDSARLVLSSGYVWTLFQSIVEQGQRRVGEALPQLVSDWNTGKGWDHAVGTVEVSEQSALELSSALRALTDSDLALGWSAELREAALRCAECIATFVSEHIDRGRTLFIERVSRGFFSGRTDD